MSLGYKPLSADEEAIGKAIVNGAFQVHKRLGSGLLEKIYEVCLIHELKKSGLVVERQIAIPIIYDDHTFEEGLRLDVLVEKKVVVEVKAVDELNPVYGSQVLSQLKLGNYRLGYLINFHVPLIKDGITRIIL